MLDTHLWLELLVFADPSAQGWLAWLRAREARGVLGPAVWAELQHVLRNTPWAKRDWLARAMACLEQCDGKADKDAGEAPAQAQTEPLREACGLALDWFDADVEISGLPRCKDASDQKFIALAAAADAPLLLSKDRALLKCRRYPLRGGGQGRILPPLLRALQAATAPPLRMQG